MNRQRKEYSMNRQGRRTKRYKLKYTKISKLLHILVILMVIMLPQQFYPIISHAEYEDITIENQSQTTDGSKKFVLKPRGDTNKRRSLENRTMYHADLEPTGIFVKKGEHIKIQVHNTDNSAKLYATIGQIGTYEYLNDNKDIGYTDLELKSGDNNIVFDKGDGMLYLKNTSETNTITVSIWGGEDVPKFILGETKQEEWINMLEKMQKAPFVELVGKHVFGTFQYPLAAKSLKNRSVEDLLKYWDKVYLIQNEVSGLDLNANGVAQKYDNSIHIVNPDNGAGYAYATSGYISFQKNTSAGKDILSTPSDQEQWGVWHEMGHTYQNPDYTWSGLGEVTVNIPALVIQEKLGFTNRLKGSKKEISDFLELKDPNKNFDNASVWVKLGMFEQLRQSYGNNFYPKLNQEYRVLKNHNLNTDDSKKQLFIQMTSKVTHRNLLPFFEKWGLYANDETKKIVEQYPKITIPIWNNIIEENKIVDRELSPYIIPIANIKATPTALLGEQDSSHLDVSKFLTNIRNLNDDSNVNISATPSSIEAFKVGEKAGNLLVKLTNTYGNSNLIRIPVNVEYGDTLEFLGLGSYLVGNLTVHPETKKLSFLGTNNSVHSYFTGEEYMGVEIYNKNKRQKVNVKVQGQESTKSTLENVINGLTYEEGDIIQIYHAEPSRFKYYYGNTEMTKEGNKTYLFKIKNNRLEQVNAETDVPNTGEKPNTGETP
ncbi:M60 family metallopeptidase, partial [Bacillus sp. NPDC094077]|uniref:M60 family metallopeptidase n=1 Tax=Bacillus sp. NPDC094077 TaxID=3390932 RepID=UPI003D02F6AB